MVNGTAFKCGTRVRIPVLYPDQPDSFGRVTRVHASYRPMPAGYVPIRFDAGGIVLVHVSSIVCAE